MPNDLTPTAEDLARDLAFDLAAFEALMAARHVGGFVQGALQIGSTLLLAVIPAAVRRALAAEAEVERLRAALAERTTGPGRAADG